MVVLRCLYAARICGRICQPLRYSPPTRLPRFGLYGFAFALLRVGSMTSYRAAARWRSYCGLACLWFTAALPCCGRRFPLRFVAGAAHARLPAARFRQRTRVYRGGLPARLRTASVADALPFRIACDAWSSLQICRRRCCRLPLPTTAL